VKARKLRPVNNWGRYPVVQARTYTFQTIPELRAFVTSARSFITRGSGLCYGDASLAPVILSTLRFNKILEFDREKGYIRCEAGVTLEDILKVIVPAGWFLPVVPGTKFITVGGAVAADVHGKNHHKDGSFTKYVSSLAVMVNSGDVLNCSREANVDVFHATCGGMGLTGVILEAGIHLTKVKTAYVVQKNIIARDLTTLTSLLKEHDSSTFSVAWVDCLATGDRLGRGVLMLGEYAQVDELNESDREFPLRVHKKARLKVPFSMPTFLLNPFTVGAFNNAFYRKHQWSKKEFPVHYDNFFFPLDFIRHWNKLYGKRGFLQYQFVVPFDGGDKALREILSMISKSKLASFLSVLKLLGPGEHPLSFPIPGYTLALDFPLSPALFPLLDALDKLVAASGGRIYLAKDSRMKLETFNGGYPQVERIREHMKDIKDSKFGSLLSDRLSIIKP
jgi:decaprenylphospho-beta-D-ribofuranose 2-oxidase